MLELLYKHNHFYPPRVIRIQRVTGWRPRRDSNPTCWFRRPTGYPLPHGAETPTMIRIEILFFEKQHIRPLCAWTACRIFGQTMPYGRIVLPRWGFGNRSDTDRHKERQTESIRPRLHGIKRFQAIGLLRTGCPSGGPGLRNP